MLTERTLKNWRRDALSNRAILHITQTDDMVSCSRMNLIEYQERILRLTAKLLDQYLLERSKK